MGGENSALVAAGGSDPILRIWDPRKPGKQCNSFLSKLMSTIFLLLTLAEVANPSSTGTLAPVFQFASHSSWITACKWHPRSWFHLLSASYDGKVMLWDLRTAV